MSNPHVRETDSVETVHGQKVAIGVDYDAVTVNGLQLGPEVRDDFARLYFLADAEAKAFAEANGERPRAESDCVCLRGGDCPCEADGDDGYCTCCRDGDHNGSCAAPGAEAHGAVSG